MVPAYVTLIVNNEQAVKLANQEYDGTVHLVLYPEIEATEDAKDTKDAATTTKKDKPAADTNTAQDAPQTPAEGEDAAQQDAAA